MRLRGVFRARRARAGLPLTDLAVSRAQGGNRSGQLLDDRALTSRDFPEQVLDLRTQA